MFGITIMEVTLALTILLFIASVVNVMVLGKALELIDEIHDWIIARESAHKTSKEAQNELKKLFEDEWP